MFWETLDKRRITLLKKIVSNMPMQNSYLGGGTALALQLGHRKSYDFDWLTTEVFTPESLQRDLAQIGELNDVSLADGTFHGNLDNIRLTWLYYPNPLTRPLIETKEIPGLYLASIEDIGLMKIVAISSRGARRDFYDLYIICHNGLKLSYLINKLPRKFPDSQINIYHLVKSLTYFDDAENEPPPDCIIDISWEKVKQFLREQQNQLIDVIQKKQL